ncbi:AAA family ATPase [Luminiphilus sp. nBUS_07]|uniref:AAA family ATPase n=1 Tax=Luminiphilus sp. nBUS_07 TaxID=3395314 RepID=UPI003EBD838E
MLKQITIRDYAVVASLDMDLESGMTVITGETGAGKSIMLDALGLCIGDRADARTVRPGQSAPISRRFFKSTSSPR